MDNIFSVAAVTGFFVLVFILLVAWAALSMGIQWKKIDAHTVFSRFGVLGICLIVGVVALGGGVAWIVAKAPAVLGTIFPGIVSAGA